MFTGIVTDVGRVVSLEGRDSLGVRLSCSYDPDGIDPGASISCDGCCLTVVNRGGRAGDAWFDVDVSAETLSKTTLGGWAAGRRVNLERALRVGDELGGHIVSGHVDGVAEIVGVRPEGDSLRLSFEAPGDLSRFIASKGSVALDGTSLTVNEVDGARFGVNLIPHTRRVTAWEDRGEGDRVNLEVDVVARHVARLKEWNPQA